ncbi:MAG: hypothetical protein IKZ10_06965 [Akkermansia sp.]|nr:hypothetical protein [Akkermansia sp.]
MNGYLGTMVRRFAAIGACVGSTLSALEVDNQSNEVFDLYFFGNDEAGVFGTLSGVEAIDAAKMTTGHVADSATYYWSNELKQAMVNAVNTWTQAISTPYDTESNSRKLRIGFFLDDASGNNSIMSVSMAGYAATQTVVSNSDPQYGSTANIYSVAEWAWRENNETANYNPSWAGYHWEVNVLTSGTNNIDIAIVLNPIVTSFIYGQNDTLMGVETRARTEQELQNIATHEIAHGMGVDSRLYTQRYNEATSQSEAVLSDYVSTWDTLITLNGEHIVTLNANGEYETPYTTLSALQDAAWECTPGKNPTDPASYTGTEIQYDPNRKLSLEGEVGVHVAATMLEGDTLEHISHGDGKNVLGPGGTANATFTEADLRTLELLGWSVRRTAVIPEPSTATLSLLALAALVARRRR